MQKLAIADAEVMQVAIRQEIDRSEESRYDHRLHGLLLVASGRSYTEVSQLFGEHATTLQRWVRRFAQRGFAGLREGERPGRPRSLDERQWARLARDLRREPRRCGHVQTLWDGPLLAEHLKRHDGVSLGDRQCQGA
jgi:transposase